LQRQKIGLIPLLLVLVNIVKSVYIAEERSDLWGSTEC
jgi:hypothetical protein